MRSRTTVTVEPGGRLRSVRCAPPLTVRQVRGPDPEVCALCLVGTAAGPLPGDDLALSLILAPGARATLVATGAQIAQGPTPNDLYYGYGHPGTPEVDPRRVKTGAAAVRYGAVLGEGAQLTAEPGALVVTAGADVVVDVRIDLAVDARLSWTETVVLGRVGEPPGRAVLRWDVRRAGTPLLRQDVDLADPALRGWAAMTAGAKVLTTTLRVGTAGDDRTAVHSARDVTQRLAAGATLRTTLSAPAQPPAVTGSRVAAYEAVAGEGLPNRAFTA